MIYHAIGLMSGTSLDGLDICYASFEKNEHNVWNFNILNAETIRYPKKWENKLRNIFSQSAADFFELNSEYGFYLGEQTKRFISKHKLKKIDMVASHGHTIFHQPKKNYTTQIGDGRAIKISNQIPVVYDFRSQDVLMGGNGAPLVPIGDEFLFSEYDGCINLGGFSNISLKIENKRIAFDICPVNIVLNFFAQKLGQPFDHDGMISSKGWGSDQVLNQLNNLKYYKQEPPKSLGLEWVEKEIFPKLEKLEPADAMATFVEHIAIKISETIQQYQLKNVLFTGGGTYNSHLIERIKTKTKASIIIPEKEIIDFKEALIFGFMGVLRIQNENNVLSSATGSSHDHCTGLLV